MRATAAAAAAAATAAAAVVDCRRRRTLCICCCCSYSLPCLLLPPLQVAQLDRRSAAAEVAALRHQAAQRDAEIAQLRLQARGWMGAG